MNLYEYQPQKTFSQRHMLCLQDYTTDEIYQVLSLALKLKGETEFPKESKFFRYIRAGLDKR